MLAVILRAAIILNLGLALLAVTPAAAQDEALGVLYEFDVEVDYGPHEVPINGAVNVPIVFHDRSRDTPTAFLPEGSSQVPIFLHYVDWEVTSLFDNDQGWVALPVTGFASTAGDEREVTLTVLAGPTTTNPYFKLNLTAVIRTDHGTYHRPVELLFYTPGIPGFAVRNLASLELAPREVGDAGLIITNVGVFPRTFDSEIVSNPCGLRIAPPSTAVVNEREMKAVPFSVQGPESRPLYLSEDCSVMIRVFARDNPEVGLNAVVSVVVNGWYLDPAWGFTGAFFAIFLLLLGWFVASRKGRIEEELLGKPQKPWTIPVEKVYLDRLKETDSHAWYVVRHYLMEDEYRSALMWYSAYKRGTKNQRARERMIVAHERAFTRWKQREQRKADKPLRAADRYDNKLQAKLDRKGARRHRKETAKWAALVKKITAAHERRVEKLEAKWQAAAKKARKRGQPEPEKPDLGEPDVPDQPVLTQVPLEEHRWSRKADRYRGRMDRKNQRLLGKLERASARRLNKVRRKAQRAAKKLDDPEFVEEHPLLLGDTPS